MNTNNNGVTQPVDALRAAAYERYATSTRLHKDANANYGFALRRYGAASTHTQELLSIAADALLVACAAHTGYRRAKADAINQAVTV